MAAHPVTRVAPAYARAPRAPAAPEETTKDTKVTKGLSKAFGERCDIALEEGHDGRSSIPQADSPRQTTYPVSPNVALAPNLRALRALRGSSEPAAAEAR